MLRVLAATFVFTAMGSAAASAQDCAPICDWFHDYGPYDFSYVYPGLVGIPVCDRAGNCSPHLVYKYTGSRPDVTITIRPTRQYRLLRRPRVR
jgi:hypothetical protein